MAYVYTFENSLDGLVFYVGKGQGRRIKSHIWEASGKRIKVSCVAQYIRWIWQQGGKIIIRKPYKDISDNKALELEEQLIQQYGYEQLLNQDWHTCHTNQWVPPKGERNGW